MENNECSSIYINNNEESYRTSNVGSINNKNYNFSNYNNQASMKYSTCENANWFAMNEMSSHHKRGRLSKPDIHNPGPNAMWNNISQSMSPMQQYANLQSPMKNAIPNKIPEGRVVGVYFDKQRRIWRANWRENGQGKRKTKNFSVEDYGFEEARRMAIQYRILKLQEASKKFNNDNICDSISKNNSSMDSIDALTAYSSPTSNSYLCNNLEGKPKRRKKNMNSHSFDLIQPQKQLFDYMQSYETNMDIPHLINNPSYVMKTQTYPNYNMVYAPMVYNLDNSLYPTTTSGMEFYYYDRNCENVMPIKSNLQVNNYEANLQTYKLPEKNISLIEVDSIKNFTPADSNALLDTAFGPHILAAETYG